MVRKLAVGFSLDEFAELLAFELIGEGVIPSGIGRGLCLSLPVADAAATDEALIGEMKRTVALPVKARFHGGVRTLAHVPAFALEGQPAAAVARWLSVLARR